MSKSTLLLFGWIFISVGVFAQKLKKEDKAILLDEFCEKLEKHYLFPDTAKLMVSLIQKNLNEGNYAEFKDANAFAQAITKDLRGNFRDNHIALKFAPEMAKAIANVKPDEPISDKIIQEQLAIEIYENFRIPEVKRFAGNIGYLKIDQFLPPQFATGYKEKLAAAFEFIADTDAVIIDLRENGGGYVEGVDLFTSYFFEGETLYSHVLVREGDSVKKVDDFTWKNVDGRQLISQKIYVLTGISTGSGAESVAHTLKHSGRATLIGKNTFGAGYSFDEYLVGKKFVAWIPNGASKHPNAKSNWESTGVKPHIEIDEAKALNKARELALEELLISEDKKPKPEKSEYKKEGIEWELKRVVDLQNPLALEESALKKFVGKYENREIIFEKGEIYYQRDNPKRSKKRLIPVKNDEFLIEGLDEYRMGFERNKKNGKIENMKFFTRNRLYINKKTN